MRVGGPGVRRGTRLAAAVVAVGLLAAAGCTADSEPGATRTVTATAVPAQVTLGVYGPPAVIAAYTRLAARFTNDEDDVSVSVRPFGSPEELLSAVRSDDPTRRPDVFAAQESDLGDLVADDLVQPLDALLGERQVDFGDGYERVGLEAFSGSSRLQCMPTEVSPLVVYYNRDLVSLRRLQQPGEEPPSAAEGWSFEQFARAARQVTGKRNRGLNVTPSLDEVAPFVLAGGGTVVDDPGEPTTLTLSEDPGRDAIVSLLDLVRNPRLTFTRKELERRDAVARFRAGHLGLMLGYRDLLPQLRQQQGLRFGAMPIPTGTRGATVARVSGLCLSAAVEDPDPAADLIAYLTGEEASARLAATGATVPANVAAGRSRAFLRASGGEDQAAAWTGQLRSVRDRVDAGTWDELVAASRVAFGQLFYRPVIDPLDDRLTAIDEDSADLLAPAPTPSPS